MAKTKTIAGILGEAYEEAPEVPGDIPEAPGDIPERPAGDMGGGEATPSEYVSPNVESLLALWQSGNHNAVALRVLDALDLYVDFVELLFRIGHEGSVELGQLMDELTKDQKSPHHFDNVGDETVSERPDLHAEHPHMSVRNIARAEQEPERF